MLLFATTYISYQDFLECVWLLLLQKLLEGLKDWVQMNLQQAYQGEGQSAVVVSILPVYLMPLGLEFLLMLQLWHFPG